MDASDFFDHGISLVGELLSCLLAEVYAAAGCQNQLILVRKLSRLPLFDVFIWHVYNLEEMPLLIFLGNSYIHSQGVWIIREQLDAFFSGNALISACWRNYASSQQNAA